ncbi:hypothetical protein PENTCL1PPCAC_14521, partial [Pristionchus entomophagus]
QVGPYRYLLLNFAVIDTLISLVHLALVPVVHMTEFGYIYFGYRFVHESIAIGLWASLIWVALFYQTFVLLVFHFVYRYVMLCKYVLFEFTQSFSPSSLEWIRRRPWRNWMVVAGVADFTFIGGILLACFIGLMPNNGSRQ